MEKHTIMLLSFIFVATVQLKLIDQRITIIFFFSTMHTEIQKFRCGTLILTYHQD